MPSDMEINHAILNVARLMLCFLCWQLAFWFGLYLSKANIQNQVLGGGGINVSL